MISRTTLLVILGSFPGRASLAAQQYYAHPQNQFWRILQAVWPESPRPMALESYEKRIEWLLAHGLGLWDVYASCERVGSLDSAIRRPVLNDFAWLRAQCPQLRAVAHNGGESFRHAGPVQAAFSAGVPPQGAPSSVVPGSHRLPSTSPANASWNFERKLAAWREVLALHGLA